MNVFRTLSSDAQKSVDTSQSTSSATDEASRVEVATGTLINLESPVSGGDATAPTEQLDQVDQLDQLDSIQLESSAHWHASAMQGSTSSIMTDMECSVGRCPAPELTPPPELAEEAAP
ncbi:unnamed protein product [Euphydryas editha]|uniref:Uncharacterized protein n=1 Tax=Euphydryas editha TaxID=104508 RepID=A0AAU9V3T0_EUPED|nr:unnamed protein product [Euphydryas editha]